MQYLTEYEHQCEQGWAVQLRFGVGLTWFFVWIEGVSDGCFGVIGGPNARDRAWWRV
jgi:hypothetical protein